MMISGIEFAIIFYDTSSIPVRTTVTAVSLARIVRVGEAVWSSEITEHNMAENFVPSWPIILNKSLEESDVYRLLGQNHKVRGK